MINENIIIEENVFEIKKDQSQFAGYTIVCFTFYFLFFILLY